MRTATKERLQDCGVGLLLLPLALLASPFIVIFFWWDIMRDQWNDAAEREHARKWLAERVAQEARES
jgi:nitrogen fixation-related uncharacterized protein